MSRTGADVGAGVGADSACPDCLRRSWVIARLGGWIQNVVDHRDGHRTPELLRLETEDLVYAVAAKQADEILSWQESLGGAEMYGTIEAAGCWACCRHDENFPVGLEDGADAPFCLIGKGGGIRLSEIMPGILVTLALWLAAGATFGSYLSEFAYTYVTYYASLASAMIALVFLYVSASIFVYGGELNSVLSRRHKGRGRTR